MKSQLGKFLFVLFCIFCSNVYAFEDINAKELQLKHITGQIKSLKKSITNTQWQENNLQDQLKISELKIDLLNHQMDELNKSLNKAEAELTKTKATQQTYLQQLDQQRQLLAKQVRVLYELGQKQSLKTILNPGDIATINRHLAYYGYLNQAHSKTISDIRNTLTGINNNLALMNAQEKSFKNLLEQKRSQQQQELKAQANRQNVIDRLHQQLQDKQQQYQTLLTDQKSLQDTLERLLTKSPIFSSTTFKQLKGKLTWPLKGAHNGIYSLNEPQKLNGVLISAAEGTPVHAIYGGKVIFANWLRGFGLLVIINHGDGYMSLYARNQALYAKVGDLVTQNDVIAKIGKSGGFEKSSLYFEIRRNGIAIDPRQWCA